MWLNRSIVRRGTDVAPCEAEVIGQVNISFLLTTSSFMAPFPYMYIYNHHHHHHNVALVARISLTLSRHSSLSFIALGRSSGQHPISSHSCWMYVRAGRPAFARPCVEVHKSTSLMSSSLLLQQCPACLVRLTWIFFVIGGRWPYSWCLVVCCRQDLFKIARSIRRQLHKNVCVYIYIYIYIYIHTHTVDEVIEK